MSKNITPTLANLQQQENAIIECFDNGKQIATSLQEHVFNIKRHELWRAVDCKSFRDYCEQGRIKVNGDSITLSYSQLKRLAVAGEIEQHLPKAHACAFSGSAFNEFSKLRVEFKDKFTGQVTRKTQDLDIRKIKSVASQVIKDREKTISNGGTGEVTAKVVKQTIEKKYGYKQPKSMAEVIRAETLRVTRLLNSFEAAIELDEFLFSDAEEESAGCAKRLATAYSKITSFLRKV